MPLPRPPVAPVLARLARELPVGEGLRYEPKWDGFRCLAFVQGADVDLRSRHDSPFARYFPEVADAVRGLGDVVLDGELVVWMDGRADFPALMARLHPAASRAHALAELTPACFVVFDLLGQGGDDLLGMPYAERRRRLEDVLDEAPPCVQLTGQTRDLEEAARWLDCPPGSGIDGVVVRHDDAPYQPGRRALVKVKRQRSADLVVAGVRLQEAGVSSLLLGAYDGEELVHVGVAGGFARARKAALAEELAPLVGDLEGHLWERGFGLEGGALGRFKGTAGRWTPAMPRDWVPLRPERVAEIGYDTVEGHRFRHPGRFLRWRPDRTPRSCTVSQLA